MPEETIELLADLFPAVVTPLPEGVPSGRKIRAWVTDGELRIAWMNGATEGVPDIGEWSTPLQLTEGVSYLGGSVVGTDGKVYTVKRGPGCSCGAAALKAWNPFGMALVSRAGFGVGRSRGPGPKPIRYSRA